MHRGARRLDHPRGFRHWPGENKRTDGGNKGNSQRHFADRGQDAMSQCGVTGRILSRMTNDDLAASQRYFVSHQFRHVRWYQRYLFSSTNKPSIRNSHHDLLAVIESDLWICRNHHQHLHKISRQPPPRILYVLSWFYPRANKMLWIIQRK